MRHTERFASTSTHAAAESWPARARRWVFRRHAHPVSAWSRWATTPLLVLPLWTRDWRTAAPIATWFAINPVMTPPVADDRAFATRAMLGEEQWSADPASRPGLVAVNLIGTAALAGAAVGAWTRRNPLMLACLAGSMAATMLSWRQYASAYRKTADDQRRAAS